MCSELDGDEKNEKNDEHSTALHSKSKVFIKAIKN